MVGYEKIKIKTIKIKLNLKILILSLIKLVFFENSKKRGAKLVKDRAIFFKAMHRSLKKRQKKTNTVLKFFY